MAVTAPDWLTRHDCTLRPQVEGRSWMVLFDGEPQYLLVAVPAAGKYNCQVLQTVNGKHLGSSATYSTVDDAIRGGLEDLRKVLGW
jgi:hypothetical protein